MFSVARKFIFHVVPAIMRPLRILWNQILGFLFLVIGILVSFRLYARWRDFSGEFGELVLLTFSSAFAVLMCVYALWSFFRARKISRS